MVPWTLDSVDRSCSPALASVFVYPWLFPYLPLSLSHTHAHLSIIPHFHYKTTIMCIYIIFCIILSFYLSTCLSLKFSPKL